VNTLPIQILIFVFMLQILSTLYNFYSAGKAYKEPYTVEYTKGGSLTVGILNGIIAIGLYYVIINM